MHLEVKFKTGETRDIELSTTHSIVVNGPRPVDPSDAGTVDSFSLDGVTSITLVGSGYEPAPAPAPAAPAAPQETRGGRIVA